MRVLYALLPALGILASSGVVHAMANRSASTISFKDLGGGLTHIEVLWKAAADPAVTDSADFSTRIVISVAGAPVDTAHQAIIYDPGGGTGPCTGPCQGECGEWSGPDVPTSSGMCGGIDAGCPCAIGVVVHVPWALLAGQVVSVRTLPAPGSVPDDSALDDTLSRVFTGTTIPAPASNRGSAVAIAALLGLVGAVSIQAWRRTSTPQSSA